ncbi:hypothetical protein LCGC14_1574030 [marine sediment metagenome]|uniref:Uncharacterized protein n=1 Tax=marine sediment metagenome TaxID=412755 RepID=A0A0F9L006_9ZZZZ
MKIDIGDEIVVMNSQCAECGHMIDGYCHDTGDLPPVKYGAEMHNLSVLLVAVGKHCDGWISAEGNENNGQ